VAGSCKYSDEPLGPGSTGLISILNISKITTIGVSGYM
jgi:hypothetical protein